MKPLRTTALLAAVAVGATVAGATTAVAAPGVDWQGCPENTAVECATVTVPIDWSRPGDGTFEVAIARRAASNPIGTLFYLPGGPGDSGVNRLIDRVPLPAEIADRFDIVSFDPRGVGRSSPIRCDTELVTNLPEVNPETGTTLADVRAFAGELGDSCREHSGPLVDHLDSVSIARDVDRIRSALGERQLSLYGRSYGTLAGQMYAERYPHRVRALVLDSVFDHSLSPARFLETQARAGEDAFGAFATWCAAEQECVLHGQDVGAVYAGLYAKAVAGTLTAPDGSGRPVGPTELVQTLLSFFYQPAPAAAATYLTSFTEGTPAPTALADATPFPVSTYCADHRVRIDSEREWLAMWERQQLAAPTLRNHFAWLPVSMCSAWPAATGNPQHRLDIDVPVLVLNSVHDPATGIEWARNVTRQLDHGRLLTYQGWGHGVIDRTACTRATATAYLVDGKLPPPGATCPA
ncbi:alpha/beta hydrolase [Actinophytocola sediminis]